MKLKENKTLQVVDKAVDEVIQDEAKARALKQVLRDLLDPELRENKPRSRAFASSDEDDLFDNLPV